MMGNANKYQRRCYISSLYLFDLLSSGNKNPKKIISLRMEFLFKDGINNSAFKEKGILFLQPLSVNAADVFTLSCSGDQFLSGQFCHIIGTDVIFLRHLLVLLFARLVDF